MHTDTYDVHQDQACFIRALHSLSEGQVRKLIASLNALTGPWTIDQHQSCDGHLSMVINRNAETDVLIDRDAGGIHVSIMRDEGLQRYASGLTRIEDVVAEVGKVHGLPARKRLAS